jgi:hypothetical protein
MDRIGVGVVAAVSSVILLAIIAVVVSQKAQTPQVIQAGGGAMAAIINAAVSPVAGNTSNTFGSVASTIGGAGP